MNTQTMTKQTHANSKRAKTSPHVHSDLESINDQIRDRYDDLIENTTTAGKSSITFLKRYPAYTIAGLVAALAAITLYVKSRRKI